MMLRGSLRGQPITVLALVLVGWVGLRAVLWQPPGWAAEHRLTAHAELAVANRADPAPVPVASQPGGMAGISWAPFAAYWTPPPVPAMVPQGQYTSPYQPAPRLEPMRESGGQPAMLAAGHQLMWMAALARVAMPPEAAAYVNHGTGTDPAALQPAAVPLAPGLSQGMSKGVADRWSADAWMLMRQQSPGMAAAAGRPLYGASQVGAVLRYHLSPSSGHRPVAYLRGTSAMGAIRESEVAAGLGVRPIPGFPLVVAGEARAFRTLDGTSFRPAAIAYTELQPKELPLDLMGEAYLQGGYVGGRFATPFIDGQVRIDGRLGRFGPADVRVGAGIWGGAQKGAKRLDVGPGATARLKLMGRPSRVSVDYRFRVAGDADPGSGPAVTVSTGF